jgi:2-C-methyl-D-erythritol 4-phosphate cytidylyltransferase
MSSSAGIVLTGGRSSRMGTPKAALEWHGSTLLHRTIGILARVTDGPVVVVRAAGQDLPALPQQDLPFLHPAFVRRVLRTVAGAQRSSRSGPIRRSSSPSAHKIAAGPVACRLNRSVTGRR